MKLADLPRYIESVPDQAPAAYLINGDSLTALSLVPSAAGAPLGADVPAFMAMLDQIDRLAMLVRDTVAERTRVATIMNSRDAESQLLLAWKLAEAQFDAETALKVLAHEKLKSAMRSPDPDAALLH